MIMKLEVVVVVVIVRIIVKISVTNVVKSVQILNLSLWSFWKSVKVKGRIVENAHGVRRGFVRMG